MRTVLKICVVLLIAVSSIGCHPRLFGSFESDMYNVAKRSRDEITTIRGDGHQMYWGYFLTGSLAVIHKVDGEVVKTGRSGFEWNYHDGIPTTGADEVRVLSGPHEVAVTIYKLFQPPYDHWKITGECTRIFHLETKAGHTYKVDMPLFYLKNQSVIRIIDEATKEEVASQVVEF